ncbi:MULTISPECIES: hypothetical protein [Oceanimonas]|uniref:Lipoprotein n=1 Tax=Oceanimonas doudoroffii TaxID=84158 RepID=A0A233RFX0_9GAMM|nr:MULTISPECIES: hypothetical protein [Oceanimonas]NHI01817.1 hypothetical protein [Oceanimonas sp. MB9]OXY82296.1 hypothetical protein B6S08_01820 [Oceanimonas doudoroffii]
MISFLRWWPLLLLAGCAEMTALNLGNGNGLKVDDSTPGVAVTREQPPKLASLSFYSSRPYNEEAAGRCAEQLLVPRELSNPVIHYSGSDMLNVEGMVEHRPRLYGLLPVQDSIRFELTLMGMVKGTTYGFRRIESARRDPLGLNGHDYSPLPPSGQETRQLYQRLERLFKQMDDCIARDDDNSAMHRSIARISS